MKFSVLDIVQMARVERLAFPIPDGRLLIKVSSVSVAAFVVKGRMLEGWDGMAAVEGYLRAHWIGGFCGLDMCVYVCVYVCVCTT